MQIYYACKGWTDTSPRKDQPLTLIPLRTSFITLLLWSFCFIRQVCFKEKRSVFYKYWLSDDVRLMSMKSKTKQNCQNFQGTKHPFLSSKLKSSQFSNWDLSIDACLTISWREIKLLQLKTVFVHLAFGSCLQNILGLHLLTHEGHWKLAGESEKARRLKGYCFLEFRSHNEL